MSTNFEKISSNKVKLTFVVPAEDFDKALNQAYLKDRSKINVPGFRKGKAPRAVIERMYGEGVFYDDALDAIFPALYAEAIKEHNIDVVDRPQVDVQEIGAGKELKFTAEVFVRPDVTLGEYKNLTVEVEPKEVVTEDEIQARISQDQQKGARTIDVTDRGVDYTDTVNLDYAGSVDGVPFEGGTAQGQTLKIGSGAFIPGFEEQMVGMTVGEEKDLNVTFPEKYQAKELAGKAATFQCKVHEVKEKEVPAMDDEFAKDVSEFDTLKDLKADLKKKITEERQKDADRVFEENLMNQVAENITADIPDVMVENQAHQYLDNFKAQISRQFPYEEYKKMTGMDDAKLLEEAKEPALRQVKMDLATAAIIKAENIEASDEDVEAEFAKMAEQFGMDVEMVKKYLSKEQVHDQILTQKAVAVVVDSATAEKPAKKTAKKAETAEGEEKKPAKKTTKKAETAEGEEKPKKAPAKKAAKKEEKEAE